MARKQKEGKENQRTEIQAQEREGWMGSALPDGKWTEVDANKREREKTEESKREPNGSPQSPLFT